MSQEDEMTTDSGIQLTPPENLPEVLDVVIIGGGPAGTAAAFRAKELGISALVIDFDDVMKRIRDYAKDKLILPDFGGGDKMKFPEGDDLISLLHFSPIDKDDMCVSWKGFYKKQQIPAHVGAELTGLEPGENDTWGVKTWDHSAKCERIFNSRHVIVAIGRGVPRRFDIPGNTDGIAYKMADAAAYVEGPACVIGGGTSAAEAVIAISNAKVEAKNPSYVYWSYRGEKMPKVSKALAEAFFEASVGNGNIRIHLRSEPVGVVVAEDRREYLSIRTDRKFIDSRPNETQHLEFAKERCIACIGEDIPEGFLNSIGIYMATGGPKNKKRMVVTPLLETQQRNVYLVGDILSQAYFETDDFDADPTSFREVKHRGNIKSALRDGVFTIEVINQKLQGKKDIAVALEEAEAAPQPVVRQDIPVGKPVETAEPPKQTAEPERKTDESQACLVRVLAGNVEENEFPLKVKGITTIGQRDCDIVFPEDNLLSEKHASIADTAGGFFLRDDGSANGVFLRATEARQLQVEAGSLIKAGRQFLVIHQSNGADRIIHYDHTGKELNRYELGAKTVILGRQAPDITLDPNDMTLSRRHLTFSNKGGQIYVKDLKSVNGTYLKVKNSVKLGHGDQFRVGQQTFNFSLTSDAVLDAGHSKEAPRPAAVAEKAPPTPAAEPEPAQEANGLSVTFKNLGKTFPIKAGQTICEIAEENGIELNAECHAGVCGSDPIRIISGGEHFDAMDDQEKETIEDLCGLDPSECRMACMGKITGPVEIEILDS
jgi:thioredoxin reductase/pSer/pThr/pTyr-binding forkhead associated (FHA) protein/ferredoxin